ncbi:hypothetical protein [Kitasatospora sp. NPDC088346]|uniref:hypothetical protein n=1 Tax=Kitasatospora sp. NPDC088346 TaxID=3364073 RepID=UPI00380621A5
MSEPHRKAPARRLPPLLRAGLLTTTAAAVLVAGTPMAASAAVRADRPRSAPAVTVHTTSAISTASPIRTRDFQVAFDVRQFGDLVGAGADNRAIASSRFCDGSLHCSSVALSFQIVTMGGDHRHLHTDNVSRATNNHCTGCQTLAGAYQFVLDTPEPIALGPETLRRLGEVEAALRAARNQSPQTLRATVDGLVSQVVTILGDAAAAHAAAPVRTAVAVPARTGVTLNRTLDGWPAGS